MNEHLSGNFKYKKGHLNLSASFCLGSGAFYLLLNMGTTAYNTWHAAHLASAPTSVTQPIPAPVQRDSKQIPVWDRPILDTYSRSESVQKTVVVNTGKPEIQLNAPLLHEAQEKTALQETATLDPKSPTHASATPTRVTDSITTTATSEWSAKSIVPKCSYHAATPAFRDESTKTEIRLNLYFALENKSTCDQ